MRQDFAATIVELAQDEGLHPSPSIPSWHRPHEIPTTRSVNSIATSSESWFEFVETGFDISRLQPANEPMHTRAAIKNNLPISRPLMQFES